MIGRRMPARGGRRRQGARRGMDIVLHLGAHRTGTTTLQEYLRRHRPGLAARGVLPLLPAALRGPDLRGLVQRNGAGPARAALSAIISAAREGGAAVLLVSEENLCGNLRGLLRDGQLYPGLAARLSRLAPALGAGPRRIGLALRPQAAWWGSVLAFAVSRGLHLPDGGEGARLAAARRGWADVVADVAAAFPGAEIVVWSFGTHLAHPRLLAEGLAGVAGLPPCGPSARNNAAPDAAALRRMLTAAGLGEAARHLPAVGRWQPFTPAQAQAFAARDADDMARIGGMAAVRLLDPFTRQTAPGLAPPHHPPEGGARDGRFGQVA